MFEIEQNRKKVQRALLVGIQHNTTARSEAESLLEELAELTENLDIEPVESMIVRLRHPNPAFLVGSGKVQEIIEKVAEIEADVIIFDEALTPAQQRNWETEAKLAVIDREEVIIDIFSERAQTKEAVLQVQLARLEYSLPRLKRFWTHLSRQRGGLTGARGQGETQIETDRRMIRDQIAALKKDLVEVIQHRGVQRAKRLRRPVPTVSIVGYTNAGKSTLLNKLTGSDVLAEDKLFATLDPTTRKLYLDHSQHVLVTDTVGFVRRLPHGLIDAFKATLEEAVVADLLIHVVDMSAPEIDARFETTTRTLSEIEADGNPTLVVFNKVDQPHSPELMDRLRLVYPDAHFVSAFTGEGIEELKSAVSDILNAKLRSKTLLVPHDRYDIVNKLHQSGGIRRQETRDDGVFIEGLFPPSLTGLITPFLTPA